MPRKKRGPYETEKDTFAVRLRDAMKVRGETRDSLAAKVGVQRQTIGYYANGQSKPDTEKLAKIAEALQVSSDWLIGVQNISKITDEHDSLQYLSSRAVAMLSLYHDIEEDNVISFIDYIIGDQWLDDLVESIHTFAGDYESRITVDMECHLDASDEHYCKKAAVKSLIDLRLWKIINGYISYIKGGIDNAAKK